MHRRWTRILALLLLGIGTRAHAIEVCDAPPRFGLAPTAIAIVHTACEEHRQWMRPFIDRQGRLASLRVTEAESGNLADHGLVPWQRVAGYWRESGTLSQVGGEPGAASCWASPGNRVTDNDCRAFLIDTPWSAAFVSWVMTRAGVPGFTRSARHIDYIRAAWGEGASGGPYRFTDPATEKPAPGDLLCFIRNRRQVMGFAGLNAALASRAGVPNESHCDIVVAANVGGDRTVHLIGGNVLNAVTMRQLELDRSGRVLLPLPRMAGEDGGDATGPGAECTPAQPDQCNFNRQDWAVLLKLQAADPVPAATLPVAAPLPAAPGDATPISPAPAAPALIEAAPAPLTAPSQVPANSDVPAPPPPVATPAPPLKSGE